MLLLAVFVAFVAAQSDDLPPWTLISNQNYPVEIYEGKRRSSNKKREEEEKFSVADG